MGSEPKADRLHQHIAHMLALEAEIESDLEPLLGHAQPEIAALAHALKAQAKAHQLAVANRLTEIAGSNTADRELEDPLQRVQLSLLTALMGYAKMQVLARRFGHASVTSEGATDDIAHRHTCDYIGSLQSMNNILHDNVVRKLEEEGISCRCPCPSCSLGICLCAVSSRHVQRAAWADTMPAEQTGVFVHSPPTGSAAANGGLRHGDVILAADDQQVDIFSKLQDVIRGHRSGEIVKLQVRRKSGEVADIQVVRP